MIKTACSLCGGTRQRTVQRRRDHLHPREGRFSIVKCLDCGFVFINPRPAPYEIGRFYPGGYGSRFRQGKKRLSFYKKIPAMLFGDRDISDRLATDPYFSHRRGRMLDVGTGDGELLVEFHKQGWEVQGLEPFCQPSPRVIELKLEVKKISFEKAILPESHYNLVLMSHVLEHMHEPLAALRKTSRILVPGGMAYVEVPNYDSLCRRIFGTDWAHLEVPRHLNHFTPRTIAVLSQKVGLRLAKTRYVAASNALRDTLLRIFVSRKYGGVFPGSHINRLLRTQLGKIAAALASGFLALLRTSDHVGYYLVKD